MAMAFLAYKTSLGWSDDFWEDVTNSQKKFTALKMNGSFVSSLDSKAQTQEDIEHELEYFGEAPNLTTVPPSLLSCP